jgi:acetyl-CoA carboxylase biotin carboxyl carrier protein
MAKFEMDTDFIRKLAAILEETNLGEIELADGERKIRVARPTVAAAAPSVVMAPMAAPAGAAAMAAGPVAAAATGSDLGKHPGAVKSPMVGTAYLSPEPGKPEFVQVGDKVTAGQTLIIIEAMKTFNPIKAPKAGVVKQVLVENARPVEFGEVLMIVE